MAELKQFNTLARQIAQQSSKKTDMLGATPLHKAQVAQWLSYASGADDLEPHLAGLNDFLAGRSFIVGDALSLADLGLYWNAHGAMAARVKAAGGDDGAAKLQKQLPHLCRWFNQVQNTQGVTGKGVPDALELIPFPTATKLMLPPLSAVKAAAGTGNAGGGGGGGGKAAAAAAGGKSKKKDKADKGGKDKAGKDKKKDKGGKAGGGAAAGGGKGVAPAGGDSAVSKLEIRVGLIVKAWKHESADKLFCEEIDVGEAAPRTIASGLQGFVKEEELQNRPCVVLCNMKPRNMVGFKSQGMVLCGINADHSAVELVDPPKGAKVGERVSFGDAHAGDFAPPNQLQKKKLLEAALPDLRVGADGVAVFKDAPFMTSAGPCTVKSIRGGSVN